MSWVEALVLGLVQGLTEFLPISSSAHLKLVKFIMGVEGGVYFDLMCHLGTLFALIGYLKKDILQILTTDRGKIKFLLIALLPLIPCYFLLKPLREYFSSIEFLGGALCVTSLFLFACRRFSWKTKNPYKDALLIGAMQSAALIPGVSRSASTIAIAHILGWNSLSAVRFSFLLAIPTIIGGNLLELIKLQIIHAPAPSFASCLIGFLSSWGLGAITVRYALPLLERGVLKPFAWYCLIIGLLTTLYIFYG